MLVVVALSEATPEDRAEAMHALISMQETKCLAYRVIDSDGNATAKFKKVKLDFCGISGTEMKKRAGSASRDGIEPSDGSSSG